METLPATHHPIILFDGVCNLCNGFVQWTIRRDSGGVFRFASLQSEVGRKVLQKAGLEGESLNSVVLYEDGRLYRRSTAALRITRQLEFPWPIFYGLVIVPVFIRDAVYDFIAANRYAWFGKRESCMMPTAELKARFLDVPQ